MTHTTRTVLWFNGHGREAAEFYCAQIPDSHVEAFYASDHGGPDGDMHFEVIDFTLNGTPYQILDAGPMFPLSECVSILVETPDQAETDRLWDAMVAGGGSHGPCGWLKDRFGLSWQIVPAELARLMRDPDRARAARVLSAMMTMGKIDLAAIHAAAA
ncbi:VOC family protein [Tabrizicola sp. BL-A-41-H6]|uniref:VOC family protein n=1 Tax=Tabrizicola sp. BL-A-41-H6 TaxID=3421107 RepID=UPI003D66B884